MSIPSSANASVLSFVSSLFKEEVVSQVSVANNSQNMSLLQATVSSDSGYANGGGDITIVEDSALLSEAGPSGSLADINESVSGENISVYVVRKNDSLAEIAKMFNVSTNTIIWANDLKGGVIKEGQTLIILPVSGVKHIVKSGETINSVVKKYKGDLGEVLRFNNLTENSLLAVGDTIIIPDGDMNSSLPSSSKNKKSSVKGSSGPSFKNYYIIPVAGKKSQGLHGYNAVDIAAPVGTPIFASANGSVIISRDYGWNGGYGNYIVIQHNNGTQTLYSHNSQNIVYAGQDVVQGQVIGYVGSTGKSTGPHVHFEIRGAKNPF